MHMWRSGLPNKRLASSSTSSAAGASRLAVAVLSTWMGLAALSLGSCAPLREGEPGDDGTDPGMNMMMPGVMRCGGDSDCGAGRICVDSVCLPDNGTCTMERGDNDCQNDTYCACPPVVKAKGCVCIPWGTKPRGKGDDMCEGQAFSPGEFKNPVLKCQWPPMGTEPAYKNVISTPLVIDLENDGQPEIVFLAGYPGPAHLVAMSGKDCTVKWDQTTNLSTCTHIAAADLDNDGKIEIVGLAPGLTVYDYKGNMKASIGTPATTACSRDYPPAIANVDGMGPPEIIMGGQVARYVSAPTPSIQVLWTKAGTGGTWGLISIVEDLDGDMKPEVITGNQVFDGVTGADKTKPIMAGLGGGYPAIGDFNADGHPDIVLISSSSGSQKVSVIDYFNNKFIMTPTAAANGWGGAPTVADFDGDGKPEFATASAVQYYVYSPDCLATPKPAKCTGTDPGVLWQSRTQDSSSGSTGSSVFDFNGDKIAEVVYRDECWLRVYNGPDGKKLFAAPVSSGTDLEMPVIADTDNDGHADIVVPSDMVQGNNCTGAVSATELGMPHGPPTFGVKVYKDPMDRWMPSRAIWNQHAYHITNINDDGTVPLVETPNFKTYNNYRQNVQGSVAGKAPTVDPTGKVIVAPDVGDCVKLFRLAGVVCNRGAAPMSAGLPATFYLNDPRLPGSMKLCTARTTKALPVGECEVVTCDWLNPSPAPYDLWFRVNDDGASRPFGQCKDGNDLAHLPRTSCTQIPG
jgi:hypothetical protein